jgi:hypothetical protein
MISHCNLYDDDYVYSEFYSGKGFHINYSGVLRKTHKLVQ